MQQSKVPIMPPGYRFSPTDTELFVHYLYRKITGRLSSVEGTIVRTCDLYGEEEPWMIWEKFGKNQLFSTSNDDLYFFTSLKKKKSKGSRIDRSVGANKKGSWHGENTGDEFKLRIGAIDDQKMFIYGLKKRFHYKNPTLPNQQGGWIMHEYSFPNLETDWVLCRLRKNGDSASTKKAEGIEKMKVPSKKRNLDDPDMGIECSKRFRMDQYQELEVAAGLSTNYGAKVAESETDKALEIAVVPVLSTNYGSEIAATETLMMGTFDSCMCPVSDKVQQEQYLSADVRIGENCSVNNESFDFDVEFSIEELLGDHPSSNLGTNMIGTGSNNNGLSEGQGAIAAEKALGIGMRSSLEQPHINDFEGWLVDESCPNYEMELQKELLQGQGQVSYESNNSSYNNWAFASSHELLQGNPNCLTQDSDQKNLVPNTSYQNIGGLWQ